MYRFIYQIGHQQLRVFQHICIANFLGNVVFSACHGNKWWARRIFKLPFGVASFCLRHEHCNINFFESHYYFIGHFFFCFTLLDATIYCAFFMGKELASKVWYFNVNCERKKLFTLFPSLLFFEEKTLKSDYLSIFCVYVCEWCRLWRFPKGTIVLHWREYEKPKKTRREREREINTLTSTIMKWY